MFLVPFTTLKGNMTSKIADLSVSIRDQDGYIYTAQNAVGTTEDDGVTVVIPLGYMPNLVDAQMSDLVFSVIPPPVSKTPTAVVSRTDDYESGTSTLVFSYD
jgi:hypothetical protein